MKEPRPESIIHLNEKNYESFDFLDFGFGFYTTTNKEQAVSFAKKILNRDKKGDKTLSYLVFIDQMEVENE